MAVLASVGWGIAAHCDQVPSITRWLSGTALTIFVTNIVGICMLCCYMAAGYSEAKFCGHCFVGTIVSSLLFQVAWWAYGADLIFRSSEASILQSECTYGLYGLVVAVWSIESVVVASACCVFSACCAYLIPELCREYCGQFHRACKDCCSAIGTCCWCFCEFGFDYLCHRPCECCSRQCNDCQPRQEQQQPRNVDFPQPPPTPHPPPHPPRSLSIQPHQPVPNFTAVDIATPIPPPQRVRDQPTLVVPTASVGRVLVRVDSLVQRKARGFHSYSDTMNLFRDKNLPVVQCSCCLSADATLSLTLRKCTHYYCVDCVPRLIQSAIDLDQFPAICPGCRAAKATTTPNSATTATAAYASASALAAEPIDDDAIGMMVQLKHLPLELAGRFDNLKAMKEATLVLDGISLVTCPTCGDKFEGPNDGAVFVRCNNRACGEQFCAACGVKWHAGLSCDQWRKQQSGLDTKTAQLLSSTTKICPGRMPDGSACGTVITHYRGHGCHHIRPPAGPQGGCPRCHHHFCYVCLGPYGTCGCRWQGSTFCKPDDPSCGCPTCPTCPNHCTDCDKTTSKACPSCYPNESKTL